MINIPASFKNDHEDYITVPVLKEFVKTHNVKTNVSEKRENLFDKIIEFGNESEEKGELVLDWIDYVVQEGIKDIQLHYAPLPDNMSMLAKDNGKLLNHISAYVDKSVSRHLCQNVYGEHFVLIDAKTEKSRAGEKIVFIFCKSLYVHDPKKNITKKIDYPVIAEYYKKGEWLLVKAKPKSNLYIYENKEFNLEKAQLTTTEKETKKIVDMVKKILSVQEVNGRGVEYDLKNRIFQLLDKYTNTPEEIKGVMENADSSVLEISKKISDLCFVEGKCGIPENMKKDIDDDIRNILEKYLSINWKDKDVFVKDRDAYPVKLSATDEEESKVEQTAAALEPLQTKALFFDNKKMLYKNKSCDGIVFRWRRINPINGQKLMFPVKMSANGRGICTFKFTEYTVKEDIENVIFSIIETGENTES
ncbi:MAG: hypothetical protein IJO83_00900 [Clostridia bacterium]|nr:hypothetical protein [Clostridia bacterium]